MTIQSNTSRVTYTGDNVSTVFPVPFLFFANIDIAVVKAAVSGAVTTLTLNVDYTLTGATVPAGGTLTKTTALLTGETLGIFLDPPRTQLSHYLTNDIFPAATLETNLDREVQISQRLYDLITRTIRAPDTEVASWPALPALSARKGLVVMFDGSTGLPTVGVPVTQPVVTLPTVLQQNITTGAPGSALLKVGIAVGNEAGWTSNPNGLTDRVPLYMYASSTGRPRIWGFNANIDVVSGSPSTAWGGEIDVNVGTANAPDPHGTNHCIGLDIVSGGPLAPSVGLSIYGVNAASRWKHGIWLDYVGGQAGSTLIKAGQATVGTTVSVDFGLDLSLCTINFQGIRVGNTPVAQVAGIGLRQFANGNVGLHLQRFTDTTPTGNLLQAVNAANSLVLAQIDVNGVISSWEANYSVVAPRIVTTQSGPLQFTATYTGFTVAQTGTVVWSRAGNMVSLVLVTSTGTSNAVTMTWAAATLPAEIRPTNTQTIVIAVQDNGVNAAGQITIFGDGSVQFGKAPGANGGFTAAGVKGIAANVTVAYALQ